MPPTCIEYRDRPGNVQGSIALAACFAGMSIWLSVQSFTRPAPTTFLVTSVLLTVLLARYAFVRVRHPLVRFDDAGMHVLGAFTGSVSSVPWSAFARANVQIAPTEATKRYVPSLRWMAPRLELTLDIGDSPHGRDLPPAEFLTRRGIALGYFRLEQFDAPRRSSSSSCEVVCGTTPA